MQCPAEHGDRIDLLLDYVAGRLGRKRSALLRRHLTQCSRCANFTFGHVKVWSTLDLWKLPAEEFVHAGAQGAESDSRNFSATLAGDTGRCTVKPKTTAAG